MKIGTNWKLAVGAWVAATFLTACGGGDSGSTPPAPAPGPAQVIASGAFDTAIPSAPIPSQVIPSGPIPSEVLPSEALPSTETGASTDAIRTFAVELQEQQEVPAIFDFPATANAALTFDTNTNTLGGTVTFAGIAANDAVTMVHLHQEVAGRNGPVIVFFDPVAGSNDTFEVRAADAALSAAEAAAFLSAQTYLNLHTTNFPAGLLRGQVVPEPFQVVRIELEPEQVIPTATPNGSPAGPTTARFGGSGIGYFTFDTQNAIASGATTGGAGPNDGNPAANNPIIVVETSFSAATVELIVGGGFAGQNSPAANANRILLTDTGNGTTFTANLPGTPDANLQSAGNLAGLSNGVYHIAATDSAGAQVRGQVTPRGVQAVRVELEPEQVIPTETPNGSPTGPTTPLAGGSAVAFMTFSDTNALGSGATADGTGANDGNPNANNPVINVETSFDAATVELIVGGGFAGQNSPAATANRITLVNSGNNRNFSANGPGTATADLRSIGNLNGLRNGVYHFAATDSNNAQVRGQVTPRGVQVVRIDLEPEQVIPTDTPNGSPTGPTTALAGASGRAFFTFDEDNATGSGATADGTGANDGNPAANNPVINATTSFDAASVELIVGGGFAGSNSPAATANRITLRNTGDNRTFTANGPGTADADLRSIGNLGGLGNGVYHIAATDSANRQIRGQITPRGVQVVRIDLQPEQVIPAATPNGTPTGPTTALVGASGRAFFTFNEGNPLASGATSGGTGANDGNPNANNPVVHARTSFDAASVELIVGGGFAGQNSPAANANRIILQNSGDNRTFSANAPGTPAASLQSIGNLNGLMNGVYHLAATDANGGQVRGQITPRGVQVVRTVLEPEQVIPTDDPNGSPLSPSFPLTGQSAIGFFTFSEINPLASGGTVGGSGANDGNPEANNPVINVTTSFDATSVELIVGGGFAGSNSPLQASNRINLRATDARNFSANGPGTATTDLQSIASLGGILNGVYHLAATDAAGGQVRGQIVPRDAQVLTSSIASSTAPNVSGRAFLTAFGRNRVVANASVAGLTPEVASVTVGSTSGLFFAQSDSDDIQTQSTDQAFGFTLVGNAAALSSNGPVTLDRDFEALNANGNAITIRGTEP